MIRTPLRVITHRGDDGRMDAREVDERMATARLQAALQEHILATEEPPPEVSEQVWDMFERRRGD